MTTVYLGLGSNVQPAHYLALGVRELRRLLGPLAVSPVYEGAAMGFEADADAFWNLVLVTETALPVGELQRQLRVIEYAHGRSDATTRTSPRTLDIDILTYGEVAGVVDGVALPREEILRHAFVLRPLAELAPDAVHPVVGKTYAALWQAFDQTSQPLRRVELDVSQGASRS